MNEIKKLIGQEIRDFIIFMSEKEYTLRLFEEHSAITQEILEKYIEEYLERI
jgi:phosphoribosyl-ATP pyrophosphohydrolase